MIGAKSFIYKYLEKGKIDGLSEFNYLNCQQLFIIWSKPSLFGLINSQ